jgi:hypothetical protein
MNILLAEYIAICNTLNFLYELVDETKTPKISNTIREKARMCLKNYPNPTTLKELYDKTDSYHKIPKRY